MTPLDWSALAVALVALAFGVVELAETWLERRRRLREYVDQQRVARWRAE